MPVPPWLRRAYDQASRAASTTTRRLLTATVLSAAIAGLVTGTFRVVSLPLGAAIWGLLLAALYSGGSFGSEILSVCRRYVPLRTPRTEDRPIVTDGAGPDDPTSAISPRSESDPTERSSVGADADETARRLLAAGVIEPCPDEEDLCLAPAFREQWWRRIEQCRDTETARTRLAAAIEVEPRVLTFDDEDESKFTVGYEGDAIARWSSRGAFLADLAADPTLGEWLKDWDELPDRTRTELLVRLRALLTECPACDRELEQNVDTVSTCCSGDLRRVSIACPTCGSVFTGTDL